MEKSPIPHGPLPEQAMVSAGLDYYKPNMSQVAHEQEPDTLVTFTFKNRGEQQLNQYVTTEDLQARFDQLRERGFSQAELTYLGSLRDSSGQPVYSPDYLETIATQPLPEVHVTEADDIEISATGPWRMVTFWETVVMSELNEAYFESFVRAHDIDIFEVYDKGEKRLNEKIKTLQDHPEIKIADFGTRRHFSLRWQNHVLERLLAECSGNIVGTSNVALARKHAIKPIGTFAHEMPMVYAGLADSRGQDILASHEAMLSGWFERYGNDLSIALTDTFGSEFFFNTFTAEQAMDWKGLRHDSGDPIAFGERAIEFYTSNNIDPQTKTIVFSDGLDINEIVMLWQHFNGRINVVFGWGTTLTNDLGIKPLNIVMKATKVNGTDTVKLSDNPGKHTGPKYKIDQYKEELTNYEAKKEKVLACAG